MLIAWIIKHNSPYTLTICINLYDSRFISYTTTNWPIGLGYFRTVSSNCAQIGAKLAAGSVNQHTGRVGWVAKKGEPHGDTAHRDPA